MKKTITFDVSFALTGRIEIDCEAGPLPPSNFLIVQTKGTNNMADITCTWNDAPAAPNTPPAASYNLTFTQNGVVLPVDGIPIAPGGAYSVKFSALNPGVVLNNGDVVTGSLVAVDANGNLSTPVTATVTISVMSPVAPPINFTMTQSA